MIQGVSILKIYLLEIHILYFTDGSDNFPQGRNLRKLVIESRPQNYREKNPLTKLQRNQVMLKQAKQEREVLLNNPGNQGYPGQPGYTGYPGDHGYAGYKGYQVNQFEDQARSFSDVG